MSGMESWAEMIAPVLLDCQEKLLEAVDALKMARAKAHLRDVQDGYQSRGLIENPGFTDLNVLDLLTDAEVCIEVGDLAEADEILDEVRRVVVPAPGNLPGEGLSARLESEIQETVLEAERVIGILNGPPPDQPGEVLRQADMVIEKLNGLVGIVEQGEQPSKDHPPPIEVPPAASRFLDGDDPLLDGSHRATGPFSWVRRLLRRAGVSAGPAYAGRMVDLLEANSLGDDYPLWGRIGTDHPRVLDFLDSTGAVVTRPDGSPLDPAQSFQVADSSMGFERNGDGPGQIAFAIILDHTGSRHMAERLYRKLNDSVFTGLPLDRPWSLPVADLEDWLHTNGERPRQDIRSSPSTRT